MNSCTRRDFEETFTSDLITSTNSTNSTSSTAAVRTAEA